VTDPHLLVELAMRFGTPLYVYDLAAVRAAHGVLRGALPNGASLYYSLKANPNWEVAEQLRLLECRAEVCSSGELSAALHGGWEASDVLYTGPGKSRAEVEQALARGVRRFSLESEADVADVEDAARVAGVEVRSLLRLNPQEAASSAGLSMAGASPFGVDTSAILGGEFVLPPAGGPVTVDGLHVFSATNQSSGEAILAAAAAAADAVAAVADALAIDLQMVDLGGGFGHAYGKGGGGADLACMRQRLVGTLDQALPVWRSVDLCFESGRFLVAAAGTLVTRVEDVKRSKGATFAVADAGINHLGGMGALGRIPRTGFELRLLPRPGAPAAEDAAAGSTTVVGPLCTPLDVLARQSPLPHLRRGDLLAVPNVGAYGLTASLLGFLGRPCPVEVVVDENARVSASRLELARREVVG
jgi:diaminopimelate decarboxylase